MSAVDLTSSANSLSPHPLRLESTLRKNRDSNSLEQTHRFLKKSLKQGFPPILSLKQQIHKKFLSQSGYYWIKTYGHFITLLEIEELKDGAFGFRYLDSYSGKIHEGEIASFSETFQTTSPLTRKALTWSSGHLQVIAPDLKISEKDYTQGYKITTELDSFIIPQ